VIELIIVKKDCLKPNDCVYGRVAGVAKPAAVVLFDRVIKMGTVKYPQL